MTVMLRPEPRCRYIYLFLIVVTRFYSFYMISFEVEKEQKYMRSESLMFRGTF